MSAALRIAAATAASALAVAAQAIVVPAAAAAGEGDAANAFPWGRGDGGLRLQSIYDAANFVAQGVTSPVLIDRLRWRPDAGAARSWGTGSYAAVTVGLATCPNDWSVPSPLFAANRGADYTTVFTGAVGYAAGSSTPPGPAPFLVDVVLATPFRYDPQAGDLLLEVDLPPGSFAGAPNLQLDVQQALSASSRVYASTGYGSPAGTVDVGHGAVVEVGYRAAVGLFASFAATPRSGSSPLTVTFTDTSYSSAPGGVTSWAWDFDGDGVVDSTLQNPTTVYPGCGSFDVALTVTDGRHAPASVVRPGYVVTDQVTASFATQALGDGRVRFTDTSTPPATAWSWDLDGDGIQDSSLPDPVWDYGAPCAGPTDVTLAVRRLCQGPFQVTRPVVAGHVAATTLTGGNGAASSGWVGNLFDVAVTAPAGISICSLRVAPYAFTGPFDVELWVTADSYVGKESAPGAWRLAAVGSGVAAGGTSSAASRSHVDLAAPVYLPAGDHGLAVYLHNPAGTASLSYTTGPLGPFPAAGLVLFPDPGRAPGLARTGRFAGAAFQPRVWNGELHYTTCAAGHVAGFGHLGPGCAGALGVPGQVALVPPHVGRTMIAEVTGVPQGAMILIVGTDDTTSPAGPLPLDLAAFGAPGCLLRVRPDSTLLLAGGGTALRYRLPVPNVGELLCMQVFPQALVLDPSANALGLSVSDAAVAVVGR